MQGTKTPVDAPVRLAPVLTLYGASRTVLGDEGRWEGGITFEPEPCGGGQAISAECADPTDMPVPGGNLAVVEYEPFLVTVEERCTAQQARARDLVARTRRLMEVDQHRQIEAEFWGGDIAQTDGLPNRWLADATTVEDLSPGGGSSPLRYALAGLQEALAGCAPAGRGMIHATVTTASLWYGENLLRREGTVLLDVFDNIIVPGVGYDGSNPAGTIDATGETAYAYATGIVDTRLEPIATADDGLRPANFVELVDPNTNRHQAQLTRFAAAYWDGCCHFGINVNHCSTACGGDAS